VNIIIIIIVIIIIMKAPTIPEALFCAFQLTFAVVTAGTT
jgi:ammonia channel protein AmtB